MNSFIRPAKIDEAEFTFQNAKSHGYEKTTIPH